MKESDKIKEADAKVRARVVRFAGRDDAWVAEQISEIGNDWLAEVLPEKARKGVAYATEFWAWFRNQWAIQDSRLSERLKVDKATTVLHYSLDESNTAFIRTHAEFRVFYQLFHHQQARQLQIPSELVARWANRVKS